MKLLFAFLVCPLVVCAASAEEPSGAPDSNRAVIPAPLPPPPPPRPVTPPMLGVGLRENEKPVSLVSYTVEAQVNGLFATVRTMIVFSNPNSRVLEGELQFPLPDGASVCGYALDVDGRLRDGVVVPKDEARVAFEAEVKAGVDPGLVEHVKGNVFRTRLYPIPAKGSRTLRVDYVAPLVFAGNGDAALQLPMPREKLDERCVTISVPIRENLPEPRLGGLGDRRFRHAEAVWRTSAIDRDVTPAEDILVALPDLPPTFAAVERHRGEYWFAASVPAPAPKRAKPVETAPAFRILWDASASRTPTDVEKALAVVDLLPRETYYSLVVFRDTPEEELYFSSRADLLGALAKLHYDGGTDFAELARAAKSFIRKPDIVTLLFTDGMDTLSAENSSIVFSDVLALASGTEKDLENLRLACGGHVLDLATADKGAITREILNPSRFLVGVRGDGIDLVQGIGQLAYGRMVAIGRLAAQSTEIRFDFGEGILSEPITLTQAMAKDGSTLACARAAKRITQLAPRADAFHDELLALGREYNIASPKTSLMVLETLDQYRKYNITPPQTAKELYAAWMKDRPTPEQIKERERRETDEWNSALQKDWNERVAWHRNPIPERKTPKSGLFEGVARRVRSAVNDAASESSARGGALMNMEESAVGEPALAPAFARASASAPAQRKAAAGKSTPKDNSSASIRLAAWDPKTPYLQALKDCAAANAATNAPGAMLYRRYMALRTDYSSSPAFFLDCAGFFFARGEKGYAVRILSNLAEMKIEDPALFRTFAWRLREAGEYDRAIPVLRKVAKLRPEEPHSFRDLALLLGERAKARNSAADAEEAMVLLKKTAFTAWKRQNALAVAVFAVEELNTLADWCAKKDWGTARKPAIPEWDDSFKHVLDVDVRLILSWDADNTDIDIHVLEPNGEEAFYQNRRTASGGFVSQDITTGYGPEEYLQLKGQKGIYKVLTHYYGSSQQKLTGPATATVTVYTDYARPDEKRQILSLRLDKPEEKVTVGEVEFKR